MKKIIILFCGLIFLNKIAFAVEFPYFGEWYSSENKYFLSVSEEKTEFEFMGTESRHYSGVCINKKFEKLSVVIDCMSILNNIFTLEYNDKTDSLRITHLDSVIDHKRALDLSKKDIYGQWMYVEGGVSKNDNAKLLLNSMLESEIQPDSEPLELLVLEMFRVDPNDRQMSIVQYNDINNTQYFYYINLKDKTFNVSTVSLNDQLFEDGYKIIDILEDEDFDIVSNIFSIGEGWFNTINSIGNVYGYIKIEGDIKRELIDSGFTQIFLN